MLVRFDDIDNDNDQDEEDNEFEFFGTVASIGETQWTIEGRRVTVNRATEVKDNIQAQTLVKVHAVPQADGTLWAREIEPTSVAEMQEEEEDRQGRVELKSEDGETEIKVRSADGTERRLKIKQEEGKTIVRMRENDVRNEVRIKTSSGGFVIEQRGNVAQTQFSLTRGYPNQPDDSFYALWSSQYPSFACGGNRKYFSS